MSVDAWLPFKCIQMVKGVKVKTLNARNSTLKGALHQKQLGLDGLFFFLYPLFYSCILKFPPIILFI